LDTFAYFPLDRTCLHISRVTHIPFGHVCVAPEHRARVCIFMYVFMFVVLKMWVYLYIYACVVMYL